jgi:hypothetical protein
MLSCTLALYALLVWYFWEIKASVVSWKERELFYRIHNERCENWLLLHAGLLNFVNTYIGIGLHYSVFASEWGRKTLNIREKHYPINNRFYETGTDVICDKKFIQLKTNWRVSCNSYTNMQICNKRTSNSYKNKINLQIFMCVLSIWCWFSRGKK